ncbi:hypothetical protein QYE76_000527 [Lolium multiflorum]|uniref:HAT C-terminal dimerisation domain-containing protein n=1 Tax=Lolium multiflorum TaxID=4521 RepID=A0AAD8RKC0_LOLMU|nr:hypothetical protein QYE76_000527 [Lolium multiflorum]
MPDVKRRVSSSAASPPLSVLLLPSLPATIVSIDHPQADQVIIHRSQAGANMGKHQSGYQKRKRKEKEEGLIQSQKGAMDRFVKKKPQVSSDNQSADVDSSTLALAIVPYIDPRADQTGTENNVEVEEDSGQTSPVADVDDSFRPDIFDPRYWGSLDQKQIDILAEKGPRRDSSIKKGPKDRYSRRLGKHQTIDKAAQRQLEKEKDHWRKVSETDKDPMTSSHALGLAKHELVDYEFVVAIVIWYEVLSVVNLVSKSLQAKDMLIDVAIEKVQGLMTFFEGYRETGFLKALEIAKGIARELDIAAKFPERREIKRKKQFDENPDGTIVATHSAEESFRINYFIPLVDQAISSLKTRFDQYEGYQKIFGFLFTSEKIQSLDNDSLKSSCANLEAALMDKKADNHTNEDRKSDIDANELYVELKLLKDFIPNGNMGPVEVLNFLKRHDCFPNASIAYRVLLTIPVTVASAERSFSKLKLLKSYMCTTMTQQRLNDLATISLESEVLEKIDYKDIIEDFISKNPQRMMLFK